MNPQQESSLNDSSCKLYSIVPPDFVKFVACLFDDHCLIALRPVES
jgi:hypothetical protein